MRRLAAATLMLTLAGAGAAIAQAVPTAAGREGELAAPSASTPRAPASDTARQIDAWLADAPPPASGSRAGAGPDSPWADGLAAPPPGPVLPYDASPLARTLVDGQVHGEVGAEVGNRGYGGYAVASGKVGKDGYVQVGVSDYQGTGGGRRWRGGDGEHRSLSITAAWLPNRDRDAGWRRPEPTAAPEN